MTNSNSFTIAVTDSGIGGLAVAAELMEQLKYPSACLLNKQESPKPDVRVVFYNALFDNASGYNRLPRHEDKVQMFDAALEGLNRDVQPDILLIACNTLSVIYPETQFSQQVTYPVKGILDAGIALIQNVLESDSAAKVIIFGTKLTVETNYFPNKLAAAGIARERVVQQACPELVGSIERGWNSDETRQRIEDYVQQALAQLNDSISPIIISYNCTHFPYAQALWEAAFAKHQRKPQMYLDPGKAMLDVQESFPGLLTSSTRVSAEVISMVEFSDETIQQFQPLLETTSPEIAEALKNYYLKPD